MLLATFAIFQEPTDKMQSTSLKTLAYSMGSGIPNETLNNQYFICMPANSLRQAQIQTLLNLVDAKIAETYLLLRTDKYIRISQMDYHKLLKQFVDTDQPIDWTPYLNSDLPEDECYFIVDKKDANIINFCPIYSFFTEIMEHELYSKQSKINMTLQFMPELNIKEDAPLLYNMYETIETLLSNFEFDTDITEHERLVIQDNIYRFVFIYSALPVFYQLATGRKPHIQHLMQINMIGMMPDALIRIFCEYHISPDLDFQTAYELADRVITTNPDLIDVFTDLLKNEAIRQMREEDQDDDEGLLSGSFGPKYYS